MEIDTDKIVMDAIRTGFEKAVISKFESNYNNPLHDMVTKFMTSRAVELTKFLSAAFDRVLADEGFREKLVGELHQAMAKQLIQKFGGEIEKQVNQLKSDPATRARITLALERIVSGKDQS